jgi:2-succinyl-5-enolpyruvyl-6-hydroxy-3-cyclohexene-1-carboxylate synthase
LIDGSSTLPELEEFFETQQQLSAGNLATEFGFEYWPVHTPEELESALKTFYGKSIRPKILEVFSESKLNADILKTIKDKLRERTLLP